MTLHISIKLQYGLFLLFFLLNFSIQAQILDDTTKLVYNARTTRYSYSSDWLLNRSAMNTIDTNIINNHNYMFHYRNGILYQDLGNLGTALRRVYWEQPSEPGIALGHETYRDYMFDPEKIPLYNSKSPFARISYIQGSRGLQTIDAEFTRNITSGWNAGMDIRRMVSLKQIGVSDRTEQQFSNYGFYGQTNYTSKKGNYRAFAWIDVMHHFHYENGGILPDTLDAQINLFDYTLENVNLVKKSGTTGRLQSVDRRTFYRGYQQLSFVKNGIQVFHQIDYKKRLLRYDDNNLIQNSDFYPDILFDTVETFDRTRYDLIENKAGVKGTVSKLYYQFYIRHRATNYKQARDTFYQAKYQEGFIGGVLEYRHADTLYLSVQAEQGQSDFRYAAKLVTPYGKAGVSATSVSPGLMQNNYSSNHFLWRNSFKNTNSIVASAQADLKWKGQEFIPKVSWTSIDNLIYYNTAAVTQQSTSTISFLQLGAKLKTGYRFIWLENEVVYTTRTGPDYWPVPELLYIPRLYIQGNVFKKAARVQAGVEMIYTSSYATPSYMPVTQQFYLTNPADTLASIPASAQVNVFLNAYLKRAKLFLLMTHANQNLPDLGYLKTPYYSALGRTIHFGITWMFYD